MQIRGTFLVFTMGLLDALKQTPSMADAMQQPKRVCRAVVVGAGPAGLLAAINLLRRSSDEVEYHVTLVETGEDYGVLDAAGLEKKRSWMIGLSTHGLTARRAVPGLCEDYVSQVEASPAAAHSPPPPSPLRQEASLSTARGVSRKQFYSATKLPLTILSCQRLACPSSPPQSTSARR